LALDLILNSDYKRLSQHIHHLPASVCRFAPSSNRSDRYLRRNKMNQEKENPMSPEEAEEIFTARLARIFIEQIMDNELEKKS